MDQVSTCSLGERSSNVEREVRCQVSRLLPQAEGPGLWLAGSAVLAAPPCLHNSRSTSRQGLEEEVTCRDNTWNPNLELPTTWDGMVGVRVWFTRARERECGLNKVRMKKKWFK